MINFKLRDEKTIELDIQGEVTAQDYKELRPQLEKIFRKNGRMKFLILLEDLKTFTMGAAYEDIKLDLMNLKDVGTTAIVGNKKTQETLTKVIDKIFPARVKFFETNRQADAEKWLSGAV